MLNLRKQKRWFKTLIQNAVYKSFVYAHLELSLTLSNYIDLGGLTNAGQTRARAFLNVYNPLSSTIDPGRIQAMCQYCTQARGFSLKPERRLLTSL